MDIVSSAAAVVGLVFNFATAIKTCNDLRGRYKDAARTIQSIKHELETLQGALQELANLMMHDADALASRWGSNKTLPTTFARAIRGFKRTIKGLLDDMEPLRRNDSRLGKMDKVKLLWNEVAMKEHLGQLRAQSSALQLLLLVLQTGTMSEVKINIAKVQAALLQLSISTDDGEDDAGSRPPEYETHILDDQSDLLDLEWSDKEQPTTDQQQSIHEEILREAFAPQSNSFNSQEQGESSRAKTHMPLFSTPAVELDFLENQPLPTASPVLAMKTPFHDFRTRTELPPSDPSSDSVLPGAPSNGHMLDPLPALYDLPISQPLSTPETARKPLFFSSPQTVPKTTLSCRSTTTTNPDHNADPISDSDEATDSQPGCDTSMNTTTRFKTENSKGKKSHDRTSLPELVHASSRGNLEAVCKLLNAGHDVDSKHPTNGKTALIIAASLGHLEIMEALLNQNVYVDAHDRVSRTALHYATSEGDIECARLLLSRGASTDAADRWYENPLHRVVRYAHFDIVKILLDRSTDPILPQNSQGFTILHFAMAAKPDIVKLICERMQKVQQHQSNCQARSSDNKSDSIPTICNCPWTFPGCDIEDKMGRTALQRGLCHSGNLRSVMTLLQYSSIGVDAPQLQPVYWSNTNFTAQGDRRDAGFNWERPLHYVIRKKRSAKWVASLLAAGADPNLLNSHGQTPLEMAIGLRDEAATKVLLAHGAQLNEKCSTTKAKSLLGLAIDNFPAQVLLEFVATATESRPVENTNLEVAFVREAQSRRKWDYIQTLLESENHTKDRLGNIMNEEKTLKLAIEDQNEKAVCFILEAGFDVHASFMGPLNFQCQAIHIAASEKSIHIVYLLLRHGASAHDKDDFQLQPFQYAVRFSNVEMIALFFNSIVDSSQQEGTNDFTIKDALYIGIGMACSHGLLEKVVFFLDLAEKIHLGLSNSTGALHSAVETGRIAIVKVLLQHGYDPEAIYKIDGIRETAMDVDFLPMRAARGMHANTLEDYEECKRLVQEAIDQKPAKSRSQDSKRKEKRRSRRA